MGASTMPSEGKDICVAIIGGGLVGALEACLLGQRSLKVDLYEMREDIRTAEHVTGRSINLALSIRGRLALRAVGLEDKILNSAIPMQGRLIHDIDGHRRAIPYGKKGDCIYSVERRRLNAEILSVAESFPNVSLHFDHKLTSCRLESGAMTFKRSGGQEVKTTANIIIGCDGAFSAVRSGFLKRPHFNFSQTYIPHGYLELCIPPTPDGKHAMEANFLHIWARDEFMMIALPNQDHSYTVTLFMPFEGFEDLTSSQKLLEFFQQYFSDAIPLIGRERLINDFFKNKPSSVVSVKCSPYHISEKALLMGDAAHAMVPFYGQGMNSGFEDCLILDELLSKMNNDLGRALSEFSRHRNHDGQTICDLAMYNYIEMRHLVNTRSFLLRKRIDTLLSSLFPSIWVPLYSMVTFSRTRYSECLKKKAMQDKILKAALLFGTGMGTLITFVILYRLRAVKKFQSLIFSLQILYKKA